MSFQPILPLSGFAGWKFLQETQEAQQAQFEKSPLLDRDIAYFKDNISKVSSAEELVNDFTLRKVALGAFGLDDDLNKNAFIRMALEEGTDDPRSFANRLVDPAYAKMSEEFGFGNILGPRVGQSDFAQRIIDKFQTRQFEIAVGDTDNSMRLAMYFKREITDFATANVTENTSWYSIMGSPPMRAVMEGALGLPSEVGALDIDKQREMFQAAASKKFGSSSLKEFLNEENVEIAIRDFLIRDQLSNGPSNTTPGTAALTMLQNASIGQQAAINLFNSNF